LTSTHNDSRDILVPIATDYLTLKKPKSKHEDTEKAWKNITTFGVDTGGSFICSDFFIHTFYEAKGILPLLLIINYEEEYADGNDD
jgi:hypothetical protein